MEVRLPLRAQGPTHEQVPLHQHGLRPDRPPDPRVYDAREPTNFLLVQTVARASSGVDRVSIRMAGRANPQRRFELIYTANRWLGVPGVLATVGPAHQMEEWLWQKPCGGLLDLGAPGSRKVVEPSAPGRVTMADRVTDRRSAGIED
ncbi:uncharacterized protein L3040_000148 [Drepanopeziza brunnea f. sp. 'multigermtubi']|uniref:Uncharacterized protein n=1 Tax=Marssonina brunnea f. sp. multigermtubi (strain MB_m1) TaxID=1072389 RepID=K1XQ05_MARBU|nr:uncharacterized protein MBM_07345 [Drepanopeziza brunnea f. sp. 'multigermtubi' MB_m1]EKD14624.1 hypothetical protein MBM_07345 [Drepanopeziza brunnea f. sp. 'multigermtubi' MB_m1]KAJ5053858.1 hypothetical protein L3040_000148 [Drepanopeziza brunnea f. sp. 'multigermtubi']